MAVAKRRATIKDVAAQAGVSYQTVSRVINNQPNVTDKTRTKVEQAIEALSFRPNFAARSLPRRHSHIIGLIVPYEPDYLFTDPYLLAQLSGIDAEAHVHDYNVLLSTAGNSNSGVEAYERMVRNQVADGALVIETASLKMGEELLAEQNYPYVCLGYNLCTLNAYSVHADDRNGAENATRHLLARGHRRIGVISGPSSGAAASAERLIGHQQVLAEAGLSFDPALLLYGECTRPSGQIATEQLLALSDPPTAIFALNDHMGMGAIWALRAAGLRVPEDVAVVGFDNIPAAADFNPALTTVNMPAQEIGRVAAQLLFRLINGEPGSEREVVLPTELIIRQSS